MVPTSLENYLIVIQERGCSKKGMDFELILKLEPSDAGSNDTDTNPRCPDNPKKKQVIAMMIPIHQNQTRVSLACPDNNLKMIS